MHTEPGGSPDRTGPDLEAPDPGRDRDQRSLWRCQAGGGRRLAGASSDPDAKERHGDSLWTCLPRSADHVGRQTCPDAAAEGLNRKHAAPKRPMKVRGPPLGSGGPHQGPLGPNLEPIYRIRANNITGPRCRGPSS